MDVLEAVYHRRAVRQYADRPVEKEMLISLISAAAQAPSAMNLQPWAFRITSDKSKLAAISSEAKSHLLQTLSSNSPLLKLRDELANVRFNIFYNAPVLVMICATSMETGATEDCALAAQTFMLAAYSRGLGTCWIGLARSWMDTPAGKSMLGIPPTYVPVAPIIVGYPEGEAEQHPRNPPIIIWDN